MLLSIDTSANTLSIALLNNTAVLAYDEKTMPQGQGEALMPAIQELFAKTGHSFDQLKAVAVCVGPGSFTGVRIGLAAARGIGLALDIPVYGVSSFEAFAYNTTEKTVVAIDTKRGDYYTQIFNAGMVVSAPSIETAESLKKYLPFKVTGDGAAQLSAEIGCEALKLPDVLAVNIAQIALARVDHPMAAEPLYLREAHVTVCK